MPSGTASVPSAAEDTGRPSHCQSFAGLFEAKLAQGLTAKRIHQDLQAEAAFAGSHQSMKRFVRRLKAVAPPRVWRIEVQPSEAQKGI